MTLLPGKTSYPALRLWAYLQKALRQALTPGFLTVNILQLGELCDSHAHLVMQGHLWVFLDMGGF